MLGSGRTAAIVLLLAATAGAFLVANSRRSGRFIYEEVPADRRPIDMLVDTDPIPGVTSPIVVAQQLMDRWNIVPGTEPLFGVARAGGAYSGANAQSAFGVFTNRQHEIAFDACTRSATRSSNCFDNGPRTIQPLRKTCVTAAISSSPKVCLQ